MNAQLLEPGQIKISLSAAEMDALALDYAQLDYSDAHTRSVLRRLLCSCTREHDFVCGKHRLLIEVFPRKAGCCIYYTALTATRRCGYVFADLPALESYLRAASPQTQPPRNAACYLCGGQYVLFAQGGDMLLREFAAPAAFSERCAAEHGRCIADDNAVDVLRKALT